MTKFGDLELIRDKGSSLLDTRTKICYQKAGTSLKVVVDQEGVEVNGVKITTLGELEDFAEFISTCWKEHKQLIPEISKTLSGH
jgi:hypothetical protein